MSWLKRLFTRNKPLMDESAFAMEYAARLGQVLARAVTVEPGEQAEAARFVVAFEEGTQTLSVRNRYLNYRKNPDSIAQQLEYDVASITIARGMESGIEKVTPAQVLPVIKNQAWGANLGQTDALRLPMAGDLMLVFVADSEQAMRYLTRYDMHFLGLEGESALFDLARRNLADYAATRTAINPVAAGLYRVQLDNVYDASLAFFIEPLREQFPYPLGTRQVFALPARNVFLLCDADDAEAIAAMRATVAQVMEDTPHTISDWLYLCDEAGNVTPFGTQAVL